AHRCVSFRRDRQDAPARAILCRRDPRRGRPTAGAARRAAESLRRQPPDSLRRARLHRSRHPSLRYGPLRRSCGIAAVRLLARQRRHGACPPRLPGGPRGGTGIDRSSRRRMFSRLHVRTGQPGGGPDPRRRDLRARRILLRCRARRVVRRVHSAARQLIRRNHMRAVAIACLTLGARLALAHDIPVSPSTCTFDTFELTEPDTGVSANVSPPTSADAMRIVYTVATATAQFQQVASTPRAFTVGGTPGTIAFPVAFGATLTAAGDLRADGVALGVMIGSVAATVPVTLTTAVVAVGDSVAGGLPMGTDGRVVLVGSIPRGTLAPPMNASTTLLRLGGHPDPPPDLGQVPPAHRRG